MPRGEEDACKIQNDLAKSFAAADVSLRHVFAVTTRITRIRFRQILHVISQRGRNCNVMCRASRLQHHERYLGLPKDGAVDVLD